MINLIHGDCLEEMAKMESQSISHALTSPPYNRKRNDKYDNYDDDVADWFGWQCQVIDELMRLTTGYVFYNIQTTYYNRVDVYKIIGKYAEDIKEIIIWEKTNPMPASGNSITNAIEYFIVFGKESLKSNSTYTKNILSSSVNSKMPKNHKAVMKQDVSDHFIEKFTKEGETVLDCFMGTGTTGVSCKKFNRSFIGIEKNEDYYKTSEINI
jgi:DNA modification methylase